MQTYLSFLQQKVAEENGLAPGDVDVNKNIFSAGYTDSLGVFRLLFEVEQEMGISLGEDALGDERIKTLNGLAEVVKESIENYD